MRGLFSGWKPLTKSSSTWLRERVSAGVVFGLPLPLAFALAFGLAVGSAGMGSAGVAALAISGAALDRKNWSQTALLSR